MRTFIYLLLNKIKLALFYVPNKIKSLHQRLASTTVEEIMDVDEAGRTPYQVFLLSLLDVLQYGIIASIVYFGFKTKNWWLFPLAFGCARWLWIDIVRQTSDAIRGKT